MFKFYTRIILAIAHGTAMVWGLKIKANDETDAENQEHFFGHAHAFVNRSTAEEILDFFDQNIGHALLALPELENQCPLKHFFGHAESNFVF